MNIFKFLINIFGRKINEKVYLHNSGANNCATIIECGLEEDWHVRFPIEEVEEWLLGDMIQIHNCVCFQL